MPLHFSNKALNAVALVTSAAALITALALGTSGVHRIRRDVSQTSYDNKILVLETGSGNGLTSATGGLAINVQSKVWFNISGQAALSGGLVQRSLTNNNVQTDILRAADGRLKAYGTGSGNYSLSGSLVVGNKATGTSSLIINSLNGGVFCMPNTSGVMKAWITVGTTWTVRTPQGAECTHF